MDRMAYIARVAALFLGGLCASCGNDTVLYPNVDCCVSNTYYICTSAQAAGQCRNFAPDPTLCSKQSSPCPADAFTP